MRGRRPSKSLGRINNSNYRKKYSGKVKLKAIDRRKRALSKVHRKVSE